MEIYTLIISFAVDDEDYPWSRTIEVREDFTLKQLHRYIQMIINFDDDHLYEFYAGRNHRNPNYKIPKTTKLNEVYPLEGLKLFYLFDFGDNWLFKIKKSRKKKQLTNDSVIPRIIESIGENPEQYGDGEE